MAVHRAATGGRSWGRFWLSYRAGRDQGQAEGAQGSHRMLYVPFSCFPLCLSHLFSEKPVLGYRSLTSCLGTTPFCWGFRLDGACPPFPKTPIPAALSWQPSPAGLIPLAPSHLPQLVRRAFTCLSRWDGSLSEQPRPAGGQDPPGWGWGAGDGRAGSRGRGRRTRLPGP